MERLAALDGVSSSKKNIMQASKQNDLKLDNTCVEVADWLFELRSGPVQYDVD
jgi:hypothetical protein